MYKYNKIKYVKCVVLYLDEVTFEKVKCINEYDILDLVTILYI
jgi:hypothetical protein